MVVEPVNISTVSELNIDAVGYEPSKVAVSNAYGLAKDRIDNKINPKEYRPFKAITCLDVMEHLSKPEIDYTIGLIHTLLETNGYAIFCICFDGDPNFDLDPTHITCRPQWWWEDLMVMKGFELVDVPKDLIYGHQFIICKKVIQ